MVYATRGDTSTPIDAVVTAVTGVKKSFLLLDHIAKKPLDHLTVLYFSR